MAQDTSLSFLLCISLLAGLLILSRTFRYFVKHATYYAGVMSVSVVLLPAFIPRAKNVLNLVLASALCKHISRLIGIRWSLRGGEHLAEQKAFVIVANHQSALDILGMFEIWSVMQKCTVVAKKELFYIWPFGLAAWLCGLIFIDRMNSEETRVAMNEASAKIKEEQIKLWVFPEGTRKNTGEIHDFKKGAFHAAVNAQIPVLPVVYSPYYFLDDKHRTFDSGRIIISALPPVPTEGLDAADVDDLLTRVRQSMVDEYARLSQEVTDDLLPSLQSVKNSWLLSGKVM